MKPLPPAVVESHGSAKGVTRARSYVELTRWNSAAMAALPMGLGALAADFTASRVVAVVLLGMAVHCFANIVNALADVEQDRTDPRRRGEALVSGAITSHQAMLAAFLLLIVIGAGTVFVLDDTPAAIAYLAVVALYTYANLFQKRSAHLSPVAMDVAFGVVVAGPIVIVASASGRFPAAPVVLLASSMVLQIAGSNVLAGTLKDLQCDLAYGVRTSAIELGVRLGEGGPVFSRRFAGYAVGVQGCALLAGLAAGLLGMPAGLLPVALAALGAILLIAATFNVVSLVTRLFPRVSVSSRPWSLQSNYLATVAIAAALIGPARVLALLGGVVVVTATSVFLSDRPGASLDRLLRLQDAVSKTEEASVVATHVRRAEGGRGGAEKTSGEGP